MRKATYRFAGTVSINEFRVQRIQDEKRQEEVYMSFIHHTNPLRELHDSLKFETFVFADRDLSEEEQKAFCEAMNFSLREFQYHFNDSLEKLREKKECKKTQNTSQ